MNGLEYFKRDKQENTEIDRIFKEATRPIEVAERYLRKYNICAKILAEIGFGNSIRYKTAKEILSNKRRFIANSIWARTKI